MKAIKLLFFLVLAAGSALAQVTTAEEVVKKYLEATGGAKWNTLEGVKMEAKVSQGGMEIPIEIVQLKDGRTYTSITFQGTKIMQNVFDGNVLWGTNFMTMKAEKSDAEATGMFKTDLGDFPSPFVDYAAKGYKIELMGTESIDGTNTYKVKLIRKPYTIEGKEVENVNFYYFDADSFIPILLETEIKTGQGKGMISQTTMSDYQEVEGLYFPFSMGQGVKGGGSQPLTITKVELNPKVATEAFTLPADK